MDVVLYVLVPLALGWVTSLLIPRWRVRHLPPDPALTIKPPRRYVDADGRSDFRPELREATAARRSRA
jgi:hypothetical protein